VSRPPTTSDRNPPEGLDEGARKALIVALMDAGTSHDIIVQRFLRREAYGDLPDYLETVARVEGSDARKQFDLTFNRLLDEAAPARLRKSGNAQERAARQVGSLSILLAMPEGDFLTAIELGAASAPNTFGVMSLPDALNRICDKRGVPYRLEGVGRFMTFKWVGEPSVHEQAVAPALGALDDLRLAGGPRTEFQQARKELREGSPQARKQAVAEACNAVESTMKVLLDERGVARPAKQNAQDLFNALLASGHVAKEAEELLLGASRFGNRRGRHGAGPVQHDVSHAEAQAVLAAAAVAIVLLSSELPKL
jgi:hypothetical protein